MFLGPSDPSLFLHRSERAGLGATPIRHEVTARGEQHGCDIVARMEHAGGPRMSPRRGNAGAVAVANPSKDPNRRCAKNRARRYPVARIHGADALGPTPTAYGYF